MHGYGFLKDGKVLSVQQHKTGDVVTNPARQTTMGTTTAVCAHSRLELLLHLCELLFSHGSLALAQLLQLLSGCIKVWSWRCWGDLQQQHLETTRCIRLYTEASSHSFWPLMQV